MTVGVNIEPNEDLPNSLDTSFLRNDDKLNRFGNVVSSFQNIPGLVGFWPMSNPQRSTGNARDFGQGGLDLTYNGNPTYNYFEDFIPYLELDGTGDFLDRADETDLDVLGTETIYNSSVRGITIGGWFWTDTLISVDGLIGKWDGTGDQRSYSLIRNADFFNFRVNSTGISPGGNYDSNASATIVTGRWYFVVGRFIPSISISIIVNGIAITKTSGSPPAAIFNSTAAFEIGAVEGGANFLPGRASLCFLSANALSDAFINGLFQQSRVLFGV